MTDLAALVPLFSEMGDLKRVRVAGHTRSMAERAFGAAWGALADGADPAAVAMRCTAVAVAGAKLAGIDAEVMARAGLRDDEIAGVLADGFALAAADVVADPLRGDLVATLDAPVPSAPSERGSAFVDAYFVAALCDQPRAGATRPGHARLVLEPPESHGDHCWAVAVYGVLCAPRFGADPTLPFLAGLAHHLHNAMWPDAGDAGDQLLGPRLAAIQARLADEALDQLPEPLRGRVEDARGLVFSQDTAEARAFQAADVIDRVLQQRQYARVAAFTLDHALDDLDLVHAGPLQALHLDLLAETGLR